MNKTDKIILKIAVKIFRKCSPGDYIDNKAFYSACSYVRLTKQDAKELREAMSSLGLIKPNRKGFVLKAQATPNWSWKLALIMIVAEIGAILYIFARGLG